NNSSVQAPPFCDHTSSSTSCLSAIPPIPSEDYRVLGQLYSETEVNIEIIPQFKPLLFVTTLPRPRARFLQFLPRIIVSLVNSFPRLSCLSAIPPIPSEDYRVPVPGQLYSEIESQITGDITISATFRTIQSHHIPRFQEPA
ncbi:unnamed protein product, partial [Cyprideis torosa]